MSLWCLFNQRGPGRGDHRRYPPATGLALALALSFSAWPVARADDKAAAKVLSVDEVRSALEATRARNGLVTVNDLLGIITKDGRFITAQQDGPNVWKVFTDLLRPPIARDDLIALHEATRDSIRDVRVIYTLTASDLDDAGKRVARDEQHEFAMGDGRYLFRRLEAARGPGKQTQEHITGYDGEVVRHGIVDRDGDGFGSIDPFRGRQVFWDPTANPLMLAMLVDTDRQAERPSDFLDLLRLLKLKDLPVLEERLNVDGRSCVVLGDHNVQVALDPERNFCVTHFEHTKITDRVPGEKREVRRLSDFQDLGNGLWLPRKIVVDTTQEGGRPGSHRVVQVKEWHVNEGIPIAYFRDVIPDGVHVLDDVKHISYVNGRGGSIQGQLDEAIGAGGGRSANTKWWLLATNVVTLAAVFGYVKARGVLKRRSGGVS